MISLPYFRNLLIIIGFLSLLPVAEPALAAGSASDPIETFHAALLSIMKDAKTTTPKIRYERLRPAVTEVFHMAQIGRIASGEYWDKAPPPVRERFVQALRHFGISRLVTLFDDYSGETFETLGTRPGQQGTTYVMTRLHLFEKKPVGITYVTKEYGGRWYIIDALLDDSISELSVRRSEYARILRDGGMERLIDILNAKADELLAS